VVGLNGEGAHVQIKRDGCMQTGAKPDPVEDQTQRSKISPVEGGLLDEDFLWTVERMFRVHQWGEKRHKDHRQRKKDVHEGVVSDGSERTRVGAGKRNTDQDPRRGNRKKSQSALRDGTQGGEKTDRSGGSKVNDVRVHSMGGMQDSSLENRDWEYQNGFQRQKGRRKVAKIFYKRKAQETAGRL